MPLPVRRVRSARPLRAAVAVAFAVALPGAAIARAAAPPRAAGAAATTPRRAATTPTQNPQSPQSPQNPQSPQPPQRSAPAGRAQDPQRLPEVLITESADTTDEQLEQVPIDHAGARDRIGPREVRASGATNIQEVLRRSPSVFLQEETGSDSLPNLVVRGVTNGADGAWRSINLGMYVDGIPLAPAPYGGPGNSLFPFALERVHAIDVQRGGGAVRYGPNNVAGVVNFLTRPIPTAPTTFGRVRYDTFDNASLLAGWGGTFGRFGVLLEGVYKDGPTFRDGGDYTLQNYALKTSYRLSDSVRLFGQFETFDDDSRLADGLTLAEYQRDPKQTLSPENRFSGQQDRVNLKLEWDVDRDTLFELITYGFDGERTFFLGSPTFYGTSAALQYVQTTPRPMRTVAVQPQVTHAYGLGDGATGELHVGVRYLQEDIVRTVSRYPTNGAVQLRRSEEQFDYYTSSAWVENTLRAGDWTVTPGLRFEWVDVDARDRVGGESVERDFTELLPGLSASHRLTETWALFGGVQRTFAAPQAPQIEISALPQDLEAQYAWVHELGTRARRDDGLLGGELTVYHIDYRNRIVADPDRFDVFVNAGTSRHRGVELMLDTDLASAGLAGVTAWSSVAWNDSKFTNGDFDGNRFPGAPRWLASWGARYRHADTGLWLGFDGAYVGPAFSDAENTRALGAQGTRGERPSYALWNVGAGFDCELGERTDLSLLIGGRNVLDEAYFEPRSARGIFPGAPASMVFELGFTHRF